jgi:hypothetical protein
MFLIYEQGLVVTRIAGSFKLALGFGIEARLTIDDFRSF